jgi:hypothetical protein
MPGMTSAFRESLTAGRQLRQATTGTSCREVRRLLNPRPHNPPPQPRLAIFPSGHPLLCGRPLRNTVTGRQMAIANGMNASMNWRRDHAMGARVRCGWLRSGCLPCTDAAASGHRKSRRNEAAPSVRVVAWSKKNGLSGLSPRPSPAVSTANVADDGAPAFSRNRCGPRVSLQLDVWQQRDTYPTVCLEGPVSGE